METIKILTITKKGSSPHWHRVEYPFSKINGLEIENKKVEIVFKEFNKETFLQDVEGFNILVYHFNIEVDIKDLEELKNKNVKIVYSIDDAFGKDDYSVMHPYYNNDFVKTYTEYRIAQQIKNATCLIVPTERLMLHCKNLNNNIAILPNFLDKNDFKIEEKTKSNKFRIGFVNSVSHYPDMLMFKQVLNKLAKNKTIVENVEFHIYGYIKEDRYWTEIINMFKKKKNIYLILKEYVPIEDYLTLYKDLDVCLMPLEYTEFNLCKSSLKLIECAFTNTLPVGSSLYSTKELKGILVAESPLEYEQTILKLLDKEYYNQVLSYVTEVNLKDNNCKERFENTLKVINTVYTEL